MNTISSFHVILTAALCICSVVIKVLYSVWWKPRALENELRGQGLRGNPYRLLHGHIKEASELTMEAWSKPMQLSHRIVPRVYPLEYRTLQKYGKKSFIWMGTTPTVIVWDPTMMREILSNKTGCFIQSPAPPLIDILTMGLITLEGEKWAKTRRLISPAFHLDKLKEMVPAFRISCVDMVNRWEEAIGLNEQLELDIWAEFHKLTGDAISRTAFGSNFEEGRRIFELQKELTAIVGEASQTIYLPGFRYLPTKMNRRSTRINVEIDSILRNMIHKRLGCMKENVDDSDDLLSLLLKSTLDTNEGEKKSSGGKKDQQKLTIGDVIEECKLFYIAGNETTSTLLTWTLVLLSMHRNWQEKAREEVLRISARTIPDVEVINQLKIVPMILHEALRLYPPVFSLFRRTQKKIKLQDTSFPAGVDFFLPILLFHHDAEYWGEDAEEFNPERFAQGISKASKGQNAFFPFGSGPRICLGMNFAMIEAKLMLAMILQKFSFELSPSYAHAPYTVITVQPQYGAHILINKL